jgi:hypothetical protein
MQFLRQNGDVYQSGGPRLVSYFGAIHHTHDDEVISAAKEIRDAVEAIERRFGLRVGVGVCKGKVMYGSFGLPSRAFFAAFGPPVMCACALSKKKSGIALCSWIASAGASSNPRIAKVGSMEIHSHFAGSGESRHKASSSDD